MRTVFKYYKSYIPLIVGILAFLFGQAMCELALPGYMSDIINNGIVKGDMDYIWKIGMIMILVSCGSVVCSIVSSYLSARTAAGSAPRRAVRQSHGFFSCGTVGVFHSIPDHPVYQRCANGAADDCHDAETRLFRTDHGNRRGHQGTADQRFPFLDGRSGAGCDRCDHADVLLSGSAEV